MYIDKVGVKMINNRLKYYILENAVILKVAIIIIMLIRLMEKPTRITYPCQRLIISQTSATLQPFLITFYSSFSFQNLVKLGVLMAILVLSSQVYASYEDYQLQNAIKRGLSNQKIINMPITPSPSNLDLEEATVSLNYDPIMVYGNSPPYDNSTNPAYDFVWNSVAQLGIAQSSNPLGNLIKPEDTVLIKPNLVGDKFGVYTHPAVVRPLIDMAIKAGAKTIWIGDGSVGKGDALKIMDKTGYTDMINTLQSMNPNITIQGVDLSNLTAWHWINLSINSSFYRSGYTDAQLGDAGSPSNSLSGNQYYLMPDPQKVNPNGQVQGWYAISDYVLNASVVINVPKMKTHSEMINTLALKNLIGITLTDTVDGRDRTGIRTPHKQSNINNKDINASFENDIFWRVTSDLNKIILYADRNGEMHPTQQRKYLTVIDGILSNQILHWNSNYYTRYWRKVVLASVDPVAIDCVASRVIGYNYSAIPVIKNTETEKIHTIGVSNASRIKVVGSELNETISHVFKYSPAWARYAKSKKLKLLDFTPPSINSVSAIINNNNTTISANISGAIVAYLYYKSSGDEQWKVQKMNNNSGEYGAVVPLKYFSYKILSQDQYFNTVQSKDYFSYPTLKIYTDKSSYSAGDIQKVGLDIINQNEAVKVKIEILLEKNGTIYSLLNKKVTLPSKLNYSNPEFKSFLLPNLPSGTYTLIAQFVDTYGNIISMDNATWNFNATYT